MKELYLIGNGFDMHHRINSSYSQFKNWLENRDSVIFNRLFQVYELDGGDLWSRLEENLGNVPIDAILDNYVYSSFMIFFERADGSNSFFNLDDFSDGPVPETGLTLHRLYYFLEQYYTKTLETAYGILQKNIYYIHGCADLNQHLIFGHNQKPESIKSNWQFDSLEDYEKNLLEEAIEDMMTLYKDVTSIIQNSHQIWKKISDVNTIHVWGLSLSDVDLPYLKHIKGIVNADVKWEFSWYDIDDKLHKENIIKQLSLENTSLIKLSDIVIPRHQQTNLFD